MKRIGRPALTLAAALIGCSSAAIFYGNGGPPPSSLPPKLAATAPSSAGGRAPSAPAELVDFTPFIAEPEYRSLAEALEAGDAPKAARELEAVLSKDPARRTPTLDFWLGRSFERAGAPAQALAACERAAIEPWPLAAYAGLCAARAALSLSRPGDALKRLEALEVPAAQRTERELLVARAATLAGDSERAIRTLRGVVEVTGNEAAPTAPALSLAELLLRPEAGRADLEQALSLARSVRVAQTPNSESARRAEELELRALARLPEARRKELAKPSSEQRLTEVGALLRAREHEAAEREATALLTSLSAAERFGKVGCEAELIQAKARSALRRNQAAVDGLAEARARCLGDDDRSARIWFVSGRYAASAGQSAAAVGYFAEVEARFPNHTLADDSRFHAAQSYLDLGAEDRFTEFSTSLPERYPTGDMVAEGLFRLALRRMDRGAWSEAILLLEQGERVVGDADAARGFDLVGRERYFRARALAELGKQGEARAELAKLIREFPLSYYMLNAYTRLRAFDAGQAQSALEAARAPSTGEPFRLARRPDWDEPGFLRMLELLKVGELDLALGELAELGVARSETASDIAWGIAYVYGRAGFTQLSAEFAKRRLVDIARRWPGAGWESAWQVAFPRPYAAIVEAQAQKTGLEVPLVYAIMREESAFDPNAVSVANAYGLMQLILPTARAVARSDNILVSPTTLRRPSVNVTLGCRALAELWNRFDENRLLAIPAYNAGPARPARWLKDRPSAEFDLWVELVPFLETRRYTKRVLSSRAVYAYLYAPSGSEAESKLLLPLKVAEAAPPVKP